MILAILSFRAIRSRASGEDARGICFLIYETRILKRAYGRRGRNHR